MIFCVERVLGGCVEFMELTPPPCHAPISVSASWHVSHTPAVARKISADTEEQQDSSTSADMEWVIFALIWGFLLLNVGVYLMRSQE